MQQLTGLDASFLYLETGATSGHVCGVALLDPSTGAQRLTYDVLRTVVEQRLHLLPPLRRRLVPVPFGIDRPYWVEDPDFDLDFHVRELGLPAPGGPEQLAEQVARIAARPLDRARPLWEIFLISGLAGDRLALLVKFHHAAVDGVSGTEVLTTLLDQTPVPPPAEPAPPWQPEQVPSDLRMWLRGLAGLAAQPLRALEYQRKVLASLPATARFVAQTPPPNVSGEVARWLVSGAAAQGRPLELPGVVAPRTSFNRPVTAHRRWAYGTTSLAAVKQVKSAFGVTVNDVVMAVCAGGLRRWLQAHDELPSQPLLAMVPISVRTPAQQGTFGNRVSGMIAALPTHLPDPVERLRAAHEAMRAAKEQHGAVSAEVLMDVTQFAMPALATQAARVAAQLRVADYVNPPYNLVISNVPGPRSPLYLAGAQVEGYFPVSIVTDGQGLNITVMSYLDDLDIGLVSCRELVPDLWDLLGYLTDSLDELVAATATA
ncbi:MAG: acyltransferase [Frankiales bacterium]|nr:acyltransferase [Frankiales bacterium]